MKGQNDEKYVNKKNSIGCVKLIRINKKSLLLCFPVRKNVPQKPIKLNIQN